MTLKEVRRFGYQLFEADLLFVRPCRFPLFFVVTAVVRSIGGLDLGIVESLSVTVLILIALISRLLLLLPSPLLVVSVTIAMGRKSKLALTGVSWDMSWRCRAQSGD